MKPLLPPGCLLRIEPAARPTQVGDVVLYRSDGGELISHRVVGITSEKVQTKGDAFVHPDGPVDPGRILGRVVAIEEPFRLGLEGRFMGGIGRWVGRLYPRLYQIKSALRAFVARHHRARGTTHV